MRKRIFWTIILVSVMSVLLFTALSFYIVSLDFNNKTQADLNSRINLILAAKSPSQDYKALANTLSDEMGDNVRVIFVLMDGTVAGDSLTSPEKTENHAGRQEIADAFSKGRGNSIRYSKTFGSLTVYSAARYDDNAVIRLSADINTSLAMLINSIPSLLFVLLITIFISLYISRKTAKRLTSPVLEMTQHFEKEELSDNIKDFTGYEELIPIVRNFEEILNKLKTQAKKSERESVRLQLILDSMEEGLIILDTNIDILIINKSAKRFLDVTDENKEKNLLFISRNKEFNDAVASVLKEGKPCVLDLKQGKYSTFRFYISPVLNDEEKHLQGALIIISDVTNILKAEKIRREFVANVTHELKTPITSIKGFAELMAEGITKDEEGIKNNSKYILAQAERLISIVDDILLLSEIESKVADTEMEIINITSVANEVAETLKGLAAHKKVLIFCEGKEVYFKANKNSIAELILNLGDNAIKYNKEGGSVTITIDEDENNAIISVKDTGIGIPLKHKDRVFERFYRVDKSRSAKSGGTGLGLSIVKHITELYKGRITLESEPDKFTEITIFLPKENK